MGSILVRSVGECSLPESLAPSSEHEGGRFYPPATWSLPQALVALLSPPHLSPQRCTRGIMQSPLCGFGGRNVLLQAKRPCHVRPHLFFSHFLKSGTLPNTTVTHVSPSD